MLFAKFRKILQNLQPKMTAKIPPACSESFFPAPSPSPCCLIAASLLTSICIGLILYKNTRTHIIWLYLTEGKFPKAIIIYDFPIFSLQNSSGNLVLWIKRTWKSWRKFWSISESKHYKMKLHSNMFNLNVEDAQNCITSLVVDRVIVSSIRGRVQKKNTEICHVSNMSNVIDKGDSNNKVWFFIQTWVYNRKWYWQWEEIGGVNCASSTGGQRQGEVLLWPISKNEMKEPLVLQCLTNF